MWMCFAFDWKDDAVRLFGLTAKYPATLKQPLKIDGYADTQTLRICISTYPLNVSTYPRIHLANICVSTYPHIHFQKVGYRYFNITLRQRKKHTVCLFVILKATECRKAHQRDSCVSTYPALSGIQLRNGRVFCSYFEFFGSKFCKKCQRSLACFQFFYLVNSLRWTPLGSEKRVCLKKLRDVHLLENHIKGVKQSRDQLQVSNIIKRDEEVKKLIRSGFPTDIRNKEEVSKKDQKSPLYLLKLLFHPSILTIRSYLQKAAIPEEGTDGDR